MAKKRHKIWFKGFTNGDLDYTDKRYHRFMLVPFQFESIMTFGKMWNNYAMMFGIGLVTKVVRTDKNYDIVYMSFGRKERPVIVWEYNTRKQLVTLSRHKYATIYGFVRMLKSDKDKYPRITLYARAIQGWYVPTQFDIKKKYPDFEFDGEDNQDKEFEELLSDVQEITNE